ncbi:MAG: alpha/beta hydrolase [Candidatus Sericytochromatia bacterium]|nr:alpha/beta hydrolase [Candidatus Sericytochromatia bacterium]MEB3221414.1 alpha/beta hydrolase [Candidatus Sericytochromatia bacterium]
MSSSWRAPDGAEIAWASWGEDGEPVLLLHGALSTAEQNYRLVLGPLSARHRLIGVDLRGHGASSNPGGRFELDMLRDDVLGVLDALGLGRVHVLGTSLGGYVALALRAAAPERVATLALAGVRPGWTRDHAAGRQEFFQPDAILRAYPHWDRYLAELHGRHHGPDHWRGLARQVGTLLEGLPETPAVGWDALEAEGERLPLLFVVGDRDELVPLEACVEVRARRPDAQILVVPRAGHLFREYEPTVFSAAYAAFLRRHRLTT